MANMDDCRVTGGGGKRGGMKKGNHIFHYIKEEFCGIWDLTSHTQLYSNFSTVKIWTESGVNNRTSEFKM